METIINKISQIESAATTITEDANTKKKAFAQEMEKKIAAFDKELEQKTNKQLEDLRAVMEVEMQCKLSSQKSTAVSIIEQLDQHYIQHHDEYASLLFKTLTAE